MKIRFELEVEVRAAASSSFTREHVEARLAELAAAAGDEAAREREYLESIKARRGWDAPET